MFEEITDLIDTKSFIEFTKNSIISFNTLKRFLQKSDFACQCGTQVVWIGDKWETLISFDKTLDALTHCDNERIKMKSLKYRISEKQRKDGQSCLAI